MDHSLAQLQMLAAAASRLDARRAMLELQTTTAAVAAVMCKDGARVKSQLERALTDASK